MNKIGKVILDMNRGAVPAQFAEMSKDVREDAIRKEILSIAGLDTFEKKAFRKALRRPDVKVAIFEIIEEVVDANIALKGEQSDFYKMFVETKNLALGDENLFVMPAKCDMVVSEFSGSYVQARRQRVQSNATFSLEMRNFVISAYTYLESMIAGRTDIAHFIALLNEAISKAIDKMVITAFQTGIAGVLPTFSVTGAYSEDACLEMLSKLEAVNDSGRPILIGTPLAIRKLQKAETTLYSDSMKEELGSNIHLANWLGYTCIEIEQTLDEKLDFVLDNKVYAVCGSDTKMVKCVFEGESFVKSNEENPMNNADLSIEYTVAYRANACLVSNKAIGVIDIA